jgi:hypothetical protein
MRTSKPKRTRKGNNGTGETLTILFDSSDPQEARALEMAKLLAEKHGRRKATIVALLDTMYQHYQATGELLSATDIARAVGNGKSATSFTPAVGFAMPAPSAQSLAAPVPEVVPPRGGVTILNDGPTGKMSGSQVAKNFLSNASSFFS